MNRELLVTLIRKNIDELIMLTEGFLEMDTYPAAIINLAKNKTDDIWSYINQLGNIKPEELQQVVANMPVVAETPGTTEKDDIKEYQETAKNEGPADEEEMNPDQNNDYDDEEEMKNAFEDDEFSEEEEEEDIIVGDESDEEEEQEEDTTTGDEPDEEEQEEEEEEDNDDDPVLQEEIVDDNAIEITEDIITVEFTETIEEKQSATTDNDNVVTTTETIEKKITLAERISGNGISRNEMMARGENGGLNAAIGNKKVDDIRQAISLGDRFRFQRELFKNNGEEMNKTLSYINKLATYEEVVSFLQSKYGWEDGSAAAEDFYQIIKRKF